MTVNSIKTKDNNINSSQNVIKAVPFPLIESFKIDIDKIQINADFKINLSYFEKMQLTEKLLEAHKLADVNVQAGNITKRGFAANVMTSDGHWAVGTNFNNTRNDISSVCAERSAILASYNNALMRFSKSAKKEFEFKIKYICMAKSEELSELSDVPVPCEDCLSWLNTTKYFDENTLIVSFERKNKTLCLKFSKLKDFLPYKDFELSAEFDKNKTIKYSNDSADLIKNLGLNEKIIYNFMNLNRKLYNENCFVKMSCQNVVCSILTNKKVYTSSKIDWTKRWYVEPLEMSCTKALEEEKDNCKIIAISYFGDNYSKNIETGEIYKDGGISIKSLGRIRQKYASGNTLLFLNLKDYIYVVTMGEYMPKKFVQGYKIV